MGNAGAPPNLERLVLSRAHQHTHSLEFLNTGNPAPAPGPDPELVAFPHVGHMAQIVKHGRAGGVFSSRNRMVSSSVSAKNILININLDLVSHPDGSPVLFALAYAAVESCEICPEISVFAGK